MLDLKKYKLRPVVVEGEPLSNEFKNEPLIYDVSKMIPRRVIEKAVREVQETLESGWTIRLTNGFSENIHDIVGVLQGIRKVGDEIYIDGRFLDTELAQQVESIPNKCFHMWYDIDDKY